MLGVDTAAALRSTGVVDVLVAADLPGQFWTGPVRADRPVLAAGVVRHVGEPVAAVLATDPASATRAAYAVGVAYRPLPEVSWFRGEEADPLHPDGNVVRTVHVRRGEWPKAAGTVVEGSYNTHGWVPRQERFGTDGAPAVPALIEAEPTDTGVRIAAPRRWHPEDRDQIAQCLNLIPRQVELRSTGSRDHSTDLGGPVLAALFARRHHRPVSLVVGPPTHGQGGGPFVVARYRHHVRPDGTLAAVSGEIEIEIGPYAGIGESLVAELCAVGVGPYRVPAVDLRVRALRSTTPPPLIEPGAAAAAVTFAVEAQLDRLADLLSYPQGREAARFVADRRAVRERNLLGLDEPFPTGQMPLEASPLPALLELLDAAPLPSMPDGGRDHAWGVGTGFGVVPFGTAEGFALPVTATVSHRAGTVSCPAAEGDESLEAAAVAVATRAFDVPMRFAATGEPAPGGSAATVGRAVTAAVEALTAPARERLGSQVGLSPALLRAAAGRLRSFDGVVDVPLAEALAGDPDPAEATYVPPDTEVLDGDGQGDAFAGFAYAAARAVLSLTARGEVEIVQLDVAADCGQVLDDVRARAAVDASVSTGVRLALPEATVRPDAVRLHLLDGPVPKGAAGVAAGAVAAALRSAHDAGAGGDAEVLPIPGVSWSSS
ncbi:molybdopterin-dependent oxidoreductase [Sporichthya brevicatena]|uniref:Molybdopterin-dependent oxidoreductase n=1 Tax=Sporichthya brevicatena TaxID=171442 RepID=A0ABP3R9Q9_9ACTN